MSRYRKKPVVVEATQWFKHGDHPAVEKDMRYVVDSSHGLIRTLEDSFEGAHHVTPGDWIITGVKGEHYACKPDIFEATYEAAAPAQQDAGETTHKLIEDAANLIEDHGDASMANDMREFRKHVPNVPFHGLNRYPTSLEAQEQEEHLETLLKNAAPQRADTATPAIGKFERNALPGHFEASASAAPPPDARSAEDSELRAIASRHARNAVAPLGSNVHPGDPIVMQEKLRAEEIIFYALKEAAARSQGIVRVGRESTWDCSGAAPRKSAAPKGDAS